MRRNQALETLDLGLGFQLAAVGTEVLLAATRRHEAPVHGLLFFAQRLLRDVDAIQTNHHIATIGQADASEVRLVSRAWLGHAEDLLQHQRINRLLVARSGFHHLPGLTILRLRNRGLTLTQTAEQRLTLGLHSLAGTLQGQLLTNAGSNLVERQQRRLEMFLNAQNNHGVRVQFNRAAVGTVFQHFLAESGLNHLAVGRQTRTTFATKGCAGFHLQTLLLSWLDQVGGFKGGVFQLLADFDKTLLNLLRFKVGHQLVFQAGQAWHFWRLHAQQLDQVPAELGADRSRDFALLQSVQSLFKSRVVYAWGGVTKITTFVRRTWIIGEFFGQNGKVLTLDQALGNGVNLRFCLGVTQLIRHFQQDVCGLTLLRQIGDFLLIGRLQVFIFDLDLIEEIGLVQLDILQNHLFRAHELAAVFLVVGLQLVIAQRDGLGISLQGQRREVAGLLLQSGKRLDFLIGDKTTARNTGLQLTGENVFLELLTELQTGIAFLTNTLVEQIGIELALNLKGRDLNNHLIQLCLRQSKTCLLCSLQQQLAVNQTLERSFTEHFVIEQRSIKILAQALHQLAALHFSSLRQFILTDGLAIYFSCILTIAGDLKNGINARQRQQRDDHADDGLGNPAL